MVDVKDGFCYYVVMGKINRQRHIRLGAKDPHEGNKRTHDGRLIKPCAYIGRHKMVGTVDGTIIRDAAGVAVPYSQLINGGIYAT